MDFKIVDSLIQNRYNQSVRYSLIISIETESEYLLIPILNEVKMTERISYSIRRCFGRILIQSA